MIAVARCLVQQIEHGAAEGLKQAWLMHTLAHDFQILKGKQAGRW